jgi:hypothetical protein
MKSNLSKFAGKKLLYLEHLITGVRKMLLKVFHLLATSVWFCTQSKEQNLGLQTKQLVPKPLSFCQIIASHIDMDMSYTRVLHITVAYRASHKWRHAFYVTRPLLCARITCYVTVIYVTRPLLCARITYYVTVITVEMNRCSFRRVRFALLYIVTRSKIV